MRGLFGIPSVSASEPDIAEKAQVIDYVKEFMTKRVRYEWAFEENDYAQYFDTATRSISNLAGNFAQTMKFYQDTRKLADHYIENLEIDYVVHDYQKTSQGYQVNLSEFYSMTSLTAMVCLASMKSDTPCSLPSASKT